MVKSYNISRNIYLIFFIIGIIVHYLLFGLWLWFNGMDITLLFQVVFHSLISLIFLADSILGFIIILIFGFYNLSFTKFMLLALFSILAGISAGLPLLLYFIYQPEPKLIVTK